MSEFNTNPKMYNLLDEKWILALGKDGRRRELSLKEAFEQAGATACLANELPTLDVAILRLLLAILHSSLARGITGYEDAIDKWRGWWEKGLPADEVAAYLEQWRERFWLFHETRPFYQVAGLDKRAVSNKGFLGVKIPKFIGVLAQSDNKEKLFRTLSGEAEESVSFSEAARWLLYTNAFLEGGNVTYKSLSYKDKDEQLPIGPGWLGEFGLIHAVGDSLERTLLLNLVLLNDDGEPWEPGKPCWEDDNPSTEERRPVPHPKSQAELLALQSRRLLLKTEGDKVTYCYVLGGDSFPKENAHRVEQMSGWYKPKGKEVFLPRGYEPAKLMWRDFGALTVSGENNRRPGVVNWIATLTWEDALSGMASFASAGVLYGGGTQRSLVDDLGSDSVSFNAALLSRLGEGWMSMVGEVLDQTEKAVKTVGKLALDLTEAAGDNRDNKGKPSPAMKGARESATAEAYFRLDEPFREWLRGIDPRNDDIDGRRGQWLDVAGKLLRRLGGELVRRAGAKAFAGRGEKNAPKAFNDFSYWLGENLSFGGGFQEKREDLNGGI
jgi:CRISPR system Cascade subunit CasA